jgi:hypothetical protein
LGDENSIKTFDYALLIKTHTRLEGQNANAFCFLKSTTMGQPHRHHRRPVEHNDAVLLVRLECNAIFQILAHVWWSICETCIKYDLQNEFQMATTQVSHAEQAGQRDLTVT